MFGLDKRSELPKLPKDWKLPKEFMDQRIEFLVGEAGRSRSCNSRFGDGGGGTYRKGIAKSERGSSRLVGASPTWRGPSHCIVAREPMLQFCMSCFNTFMSTHPG